MKIRHKIAAWYFGATICILFAFSYSAYWQLRSLLYEVIDNEIKEYIKVVENSYDPVTGRFMRTIISERINRVFDRYYIALATANGDTVMQTPLVRQLKFDFQPEDHRSGRHVTIELIPDNLPSHILLDDEELTLRAVSYDIVRGNKVVGVLSIARDIEEIDRELRNLIRTLSRISAAFLLVVAVVGIFATKKVLSPIKEIGRKPREIARNNSRERIKIFNEKDELGQLSLVLNDSIDRVQRAFESQREFMADAAHELKTPIAILRTHWETELNNPSLSLEFKEKLVKDIETLSRLTYLINNLLMLSQTESIHTNFEFSAVQLNEILADVISNAEVLAELKSQEIETNNLPEITLNGDKIRLYQLLFNIVDNAIKYTPEKGKISIHLSQENNRALIKIRDNGPGIPEKDLPHIFRRFYRVHKDRARKTGGSGLGLAIAKLIAESHKGKIFVESAVNKGTTFTIEIPVFLESSNSS